MQGGDDAAAADIADDPHWFVENYDARKETLSFVRTDRDVLARQPFLDDRWTRKALEHREVPLEALAARLPQETPPPNLNFIWHTSFCCSTLMAEALDLPGRNLSLREPLVLPRVAVAKRAATLANRPMPPRLTELVLRLLGRSLIGSERVTVKPSNFANALISDAARQSRGKALFLYSDLESFLISIEKGGSGLYKYARHLFDHIAGADGTPPPWTPQEILKMSDLEVAALAWHMQIAGFRRSAPHFEPGRVASLDCAAFLSNPAEVLAVLDKFFELELGEDYLDRIVAGPLLKRNAKQPSHPFDAHRRRAQSEGVRERLGGELKRVVEWSYRACPGTPHGPPLPGGLFS